MTDETTPRDDTGFSIVEVVIAMSIFVVMTVAVLAILLTALGGTRSNAQRLQAANLAGQQIEAVRSLRADQIPDGVTTPATSGTTVEGTTYTVRQSAAFLAGDGNTSICASTGAKPTFKRVTVTVTWPSMGSVRPVRSDTVVSVGLGKAGLDETKGIAAVLVQDATGEPVPNQPVTLQPGAVTTTDVDGCAVFTNLAPDTYGVVVDTPGRVGPQGEQRLVDSVTTAADTVRRVQVDYDLAATLTVAFDNPLGYPVPTGVKIPVTVSKPGGGFVRRASDCSTPDVDPRTCSRDAGNGRAVDNLFPVKYSVWAGVCDDAEPPAAPSVPVGSGLSGTVTVPLALAQMEVTAGSGGSPAGRTVYAHQAGGASCTPTTWVIGTVPAGGAFRFALPKGTYTFSLEQSAAAAALSSAAETASLQLAPPGATTRTINLLGFSS